MRFPRYPGPSGRESPRNFPCEEVRRLDPERTSRVPSLPAAAAVARPPPATR